MEGEILLPWYTLSCLEWLTKQDVSKWNVFEFGVGYSTIWWKLNAAFVKGIDSNPKWARAMGAKLIEQEGGELKHSVIAYNAHIDNYELNQYDCIVIDGDNRLQCLDFCLPYVRKGGYVIVDNWGQEDFPNTKEAEELLVGWQKQLFKQPNHSHWVTAVFQRP